MAKPSRTHFIQVKFRVRLEAQLNLLKKCIIILANQVFEIIKVSSVTITLFKMDFLILKFPN